MCWSRPELVALLLCTALGLCSGNGASGAGGATGANGAVVTSVEQQLELKLSALRVHKQLLQSEMVRLYMENFTPETPLLLEELQQRQQDIQRQIERLEGKATQQPDAQHLALNLAADFEYLQHKLDELKQQLDAMQASSNNGSIQHPPEQQRDVISSTPRAPPAGAGAASNVGSYFFTPLLAMPEFPSGSIAQPAPSSPSLIKRLMAMLRPSASASTSTSTPAATSTSMSVPSSAAGFLRGTQMQLVSAEELLPQLQLQRQFLNDAIKRLELLAARQGDNNKL